MSKSNDDNQQGAKRTYDWLVPSVSSFVTGPIPSTIAQTPDRISLCRACPPGRFARYKKYSYLENNSNKTPNSVNKMAH